MFIRGTTSTKDHACKTLLLFCGFLHRDNGNSAALHQTVTVPDACESQKQELGVQLVPLHPTALQPPPHTLHGYKTDRAGPDRTVCAPAADASVPDKLRWPRPLHIVRAKCM